MRYNLSYSISLSQRFFLRFTHTFSTYTSLSHTHTFSLSLSFSYIHTHKLRHTFYLTNSLTHKNKYTYMHTHSHQGCVFKCWLIFAGKQKPESLSAFFPSNCNMWESREKRLKLEKKKSEKKKVEFFFHLLRPLKRAWPWKRFFWRKIHCKKSRDVRQFSSKLYFDNLVRNFSATI